MKIDQILLTLSLLASLPLYAAKQEDVKCIAAIPGAIKNGYTLYSDDNHVTARVLPGNNAFEMRNVHTQLYKIVPISLVTLSITRDGSRITTGSKNGIIKVWDTTNGKVVDQQIVR